MHIIRRKGKDLAFNKWKIVAIEPSEIAKFEEKLEHPDTTRLSVGDDIVEKVILYSDISDTKEETYAGLFKHIKDKIPRQIVSVAGKGYTAFHSYNGHSLEKQIKNNCIIHEDVKSSFNGLMNGLLKPRYVAVFKPM